MTSVSSSMPRCFRSVSSAAMALVALPGEPAVVDLEVVVVVPRLALAVPDLHEAHALLEQSAGDQELPGLDAGAVASRGRAPARGVTSKASVASICMR